MGLKQFFITCLLSNRDRPARWLAVLLLLPFCAASAGNTLLGVRGRDAPDRTRIVLDVDQAPGYRVFAVEAPDRLVIDIDGAAIAEPLMLPSALKQRVTGVRYAQRPGGTVRVVLDLREPVRHAHLVLPPNGPYGHRIVVDLADPEGRTRSAPVDRPRLSGDELLVMVDAGHGGEDPGASGSRGTLEKDVNLAIASELARRINKAPGMRAQLTREGDYYLGLRERMERARAAGADLFISIHADAFRDRDVRGSSVYVLSQSGASSETARWLAQKENDADRIGGVALEGYDPMVKTALLEMSHAAQVKSSHDVAKRVLKALGQLGPVHKKTVQHAGFLVLKSPDVPSILVETAFISNPTEEARLKRRDHQRKVAEAIYQGVRSYFEAHPERLRRPAVTPKTRLAAAEYKVRPGDTLSHIAERYEVSEDSIRFANSLDTDVIRVGEVLRIP